MSITWMQAAELAIIWSVALWAVREPEMVFLLGRRDPADDEPMSFEDIETIRTLRRQAVEAHKDRYEGRHRRQKGLISPQEYRRQLSEIGRPEQPEGNPGWLEPLYKPWKPGW